MNIAAIYDTLRSIQKEILEYIGEKKNIYSKKDIKVILDSNEITYNFKNGMEKHDLTPEELDMVAQLLSSFLGFSGGFVQDKYYDFTLRNMQMFLNSKLCSNLESFKNIVEEYNKRYETKMLAIVRDLASINHKQNPSLMFSVSYDFLDCYGDGMEYPRSRYRARMLTNVLGRYGSVKTDDKISSIDVRDSSALWKGTCENGRYDIKDLLNIVTQACVRNVDKSVEVIINDFSLIVENKKYYFVDGLSESMKQDLLNTLVSMSEAKVETIGNGYSIFMKNYQNLVPSENGRKK